MLQSLSTNGGQNGLLKIKIGIGLAIMVGVNSKDIILPKDNLKIEYTWTDHRVYRHKFKINYLTLMTIP